MSVQVRKYYLSLIIITTLWGIAGSATAQSARNLINEGVDLYEKENYADAEVNFKKGLDKEFETFEGHFNLGDALYKQGRYDEAMEAYKNAYALAENDKQKSKIFHNVGNSLLKGQKVKESIEAYKNSLKLDPNDPETKYNLSYALNMMKNQQQQQQQNQDQNQNKDQQSQDQNQQQQNQDQQKEDQQQEKQDQQARQKDEISKEEAERILQALKNNEEDIQKELRKRKGKAVKKAKDW